MAKKKAKKKARKTAKKGSRKAPRKRRDSTNSTSTEGVKNGGPGDWPPWAVGFLEDLETCGNVEIAAGKQGRCRDTAYKLRWRCPRFEKLWEEAHRRGRIAKYERLADNSLARATDGHAEPVMDMSGRLVKDAEGNQIYGPRRFFPSLEKFHLQMGLPKQFNLSPGDTTGGVGGDTPEQQAAKVRAVLAALDSSVPKP